MKFYLFILYLIFTGCSVYSHEVQVRLNISPPDLADSFVVWATNPELPLPIYFDKKSSLLDENKKQITQEWSCSLNKGSYDIIVRDKPTLIGELRFDGKKISVDSPELISLEFDLNYNEMIVVPKLDPDSFLQQGDPDSYAMTLQEISSGDRIGQFQHTGLISQDGVKHLSAKIFFIKKSKYSLTLTRINNSQSNSLISLTRWRGEIEVSDKLPKMVNVEFIEDEK